MKPIQELAAQTEVLDMETLPGCSNKVKTKALDKISIKTKNLRIYQQKNKLAFRTIYKSLPCNRSPSRLKWPAGEMRTWRPRRVFIFQFVFLLNLFNLKSKASTNTFMRKH